MIVPVDGTGFNTHRDTPLFGLAARTERGRRRFETSLQSAVPTTFPSLSSGWFRDDEAAVALYRPRVKAGAAPAALALHGSPSPGGAVPEGGAAEASGTSALMDQILHRDASEIASLRGEFALALWDGSRKRLLLARDAFGQHNLFIRSDEDFHVWSSELLPLLEDRHFSCQLDYEAAFHYLACGLPPPWHTLARGVRRLPAAHVAWWEPGRPLCAQRFWSPLHDEPRKQGGAETRQAIERALDDAIVRRLGASPSHALLLSGGVDSSYIALKAAASLGADRVSAYTIEFTGGYSKNEVEYARLVAEVCGVQHRVVSLSVREAQALMAPTLSAPEPCSAWAAVTHRHLSRAMREDGHTHVLSGLGSDEVFGGYERLLQYYLRSRRRVRSWRRPEAVDSFDASLWDRRSGAEVLYPGVAQFFSADDLQSSVSKPFQGWHYLTHLEEFYRECRRIKPGAHPFEMMVAHECQRRIPDLLFVDFEPIGREHGLQTAYPFLDQTLLELVCGLGATSRYEYSGGSWWNKMTLRGLASERLPATIVTRLPTSYTAPFLHWMRDPRFARPLLAKLRRSRLWKAGLLRREVLGQLVAELARAPVRTETTDPPWLSKLWIVITLAAWYDRYVERTP